MYMKKISISASHLQGIFTEHGINEIVAEFVDKNPDKWFSAQQLYQKHTGEAVNFMDTADRINLTYNALQIIPDEALKSMWVDDVVRYLLLHRSDPMARGLLDRIHTKLETITCPRCGGTGARGGFGNCTLCGGQGYIQNDDE